MEFRKQLFGLILLTTPLFGQTSGLADGPNAPLAGTIVPDSIQFLMSTSTEEELTQVAIQANQSGSDLFLPNVESRSYSDFPNEVVLTLYFTPW